MEEIDVVKIDSRRKESEHRMLVDQIHPDLGEDWNVHQGMTHILEALNGHHGEAQQKIAEMGVQLVSFLLKKNERYGNSALEPVRIFAKGLKPTDQIHVRMDDKLSRLARGNDENEDPIWDFAGYSLLLLIARMDE